MCRRQLPVRSVSDGQRHFHPRRPHPEPAAGHATAHVGQHPHPHLVPGGVPSARVRRAQIRAQAQITPSTAAEDFNTTERNSEDKRSSSHSPFSQRTS